MPPTQRPAKQIFPFAFGALGLMGIAAVLAFLEQDVAALVLVLVAGVVLVVLFVLEVRVSHDQRLHGPDAFPGPPESGDPDAHPHVTGQLQVHDKSPSRDRAQRGPRRSSAPAPPSRGGPDVRRHRHDPDRLSRRRGPGGHRHIRSDV